MSPEGIALAVAVVRPTFGQHPRVGMIVLIVAWMFAMKLTAASTDALEEVLRKAVTDCIARAGLTIEQAADVMRVDYYNFQKALKGQEGRVIGLIALFRLPVVFWCLFLPELSYLVWKRHITALVDGVTSVRRVS